MVHRKSGPICSKLRDYKGVSCEEIATKLEISKRLGESALYENDNIKSFV